MKLSLNWLQKYIEIPNQDPLKTAELITRRIAEVEEVKMIGIPDSVIVGEILKIEKHPDADKLQIAIVNTGKENLQIVCGAPNIRIGQKVPVALVGTILPGNFKIEKRKVRGVESIGMMCAEDELGLGDDHAGIIILDSKAKIGSPASKVLQISPDAIIEVENKNITHRPDLFSHRSFARELAVVFDKKLNTPESPKIKEGKEKLEISVKNPKTVPAYIAVRIDNIKVDHSPLWLRNSLESIGFKSINNIVDATNWAMSDCGQPFHAFDASKVEKIVVRNAQKGEKISALDHQEYELNPNDIVITDGQKPIAIAGIIGGTDTAVNNETTSIILESANFNPITVRHTSKKLGLRTDALTRFEKSLDPCLAATALPQLVSLILQLCPEAQVSSKITTIQNFESKKKEVKFAHTELEKRIGCVVSPQKVRRILTTLGFEVSEIKGETRVIFPSFRITRDTGIFEDIVEEVARHIGYENIPPISPQLPMIAPEKNLEKKIQRHITQIMTGAGYYETHNYAFLQLETLQKFGFDPDTYAVKIINPVSRECEYLQPCLVPNMLDVVRKNEREFPNNLRFFTFDRRWMPGPLIEEIKEFVVVTAGIKKAFSELKGLAEKITTDLGLKKVKFEEGKSKLPILSTECTVISSGHQKIGKIYRIGQAAKNVSIRSEPVYEFKLYMDKIIQLTPSTFRQFKDIPEYPAVKRDFAFTVPEQILVGDLLETIESASPLVESVEIFDIYTGDKIDQGKKSVALAVNLRSSEKTLNDQEIKEATDQIITVTEKTGAILRS